MKNLSVVALALVVVDVSVVALALVIVDVDVLLGTRHTCAMSVKFFLTDAHVSGSRHDGGTTQSG
jgi:hypothetical protein